VGQAYDAIVIGAGMSGLTAAIRVALGGMRVCLLERHNVPGGLNSYYTLGGRAFDVGLHALTNYVPPRTGGAPLTKILRQLRIRHEELRLGEQELSEIVFPGERLTFTNDFDHLQAEVERSFPTQRDAFARLAALVREHELEEADARPVSARKVLSGLLGEALLVEMILCPVLYYGSAQEDDVDWNQFCILFRSLFLEGLARPEGGIRPVVNLLIKRLKRAGAELRYSAGVQAIRLQNGRAHAVELDDGTVLKARAILSSAGRVETLRLAGRDVPTAEMGRLSFIETNCLLDHFPAEREHRAATSFFCTQERLAYRRPAELMDVRSGVVSAPSNFASEKPLREGCMRLTVLANHDRWSSLPEDEYLQAKERCADAAIEHASQLFYDWRPGTVFRDVFTPRTIQRFTGHIGGAVYGSPCKSPTGASGIPGLTLIGTDQGYLGVVGAMMSGIAMANRHVLALSSQPVTA